MSQSLLNSEWAFLSQMVYRINRCTTYEKFCSECLYNLKGLLDFSQGVIFQVTFVDGKPKLKAPYCIDSNNQYADWSQYLERGYTPKWLDYFFSPWCSVFRYSDISKVSDWTESRIFKEFLEPMNLFYGLYTTLIYEDIALCAVVLGRPKNAEDFSSRDVYIMECLKNHLALKLYHLLTPISSLEPEKSNDKQYYVREFSEKYNLTKRELEIIQLLFSGNETEDICGSLYISPSTLRKHFYNIYRKTGVNSREKLIKLMHNG